MANEAIEIRWDSQVEVFDEDEFLVADACEDTQAAGRLYDKHYESIFRYVCRCTPDRATAEDVTSNVFLAAFRHLKRLRRRPMRFQAWLYRIATNEIRMHYRKAKRIRIWRRTTDGSGTDSAPPASDRSAAAEEYRLLHEALLRLKPKYRTVVVLRYFEDRTIAEIAQITGCKEGTLRCHLHRGLAQLQDILSRYGVWPR